MKDSTLRRIILLLVMTLLASSAALALASWWVTWDLVVRATEASYGFRQRSLTIERFSTIVLATRVLAGGMAVVALAMWGFRGQLSLALLRLTISTRELIGAAGGAAREYLRRTPRWHIAALMLILAIGAAHRVYFLDAPIRNDEAQTYLEYVSRPLYLALSVYPAPNNHPFHTLLAWISIRLLGRHTWALRLPALAAGMLILPMAYVLAHRIAGRGVALLATAILAGHAYLVFYATNARGYSIQAALFLALILIVDLLIERPGPPLWSLFVGVTVIGCYTIPTTLYCLALVLSWALWRVWVRGEVHPARPWFRALAVCMALSGAITLALYTPIVLVSGWRALLQNQYVVPKSFGEFVHGNLEALAQLSAGWTLDMHAAITLALIAGLLVTVIGRLSTYAILARCAPVVILVVLLLQRVVPFPRVWFFLLPLAVVLAVAGLGRLIGWTGFSARSPAWAAGAGAMVLAVGLSAQSAVRRSVIWWPETGSAPSAAMVRQYLKENYTPADRVLFSAPMLFTLLYFYNAEEGAQWPQLRELTVDKARPESRTFVVVNLATGQSLASVLEDNGTSPACYSEPRVTHRFRYATVYLLRPRPCASPTRKPGLN